jgi:hypothetical protein
VADTGGRTTDCQDTAYCGKGGMPLRERRVNGIPDCPRLFAPKDGRAPA